MPRIKISRSPALQEIYFKCLPDEQKVRYCLHEGNMRWMINEAIDQSDIEKVRGAIENAEKQIKAVDDYLNSFKNLDRGKIGTIDVYLGSLGDALKKASTELANVSFETGAVSSFFGQKVTLPQITQAAVSLHTKAQDFGSGFSKTIKTIKASLEPLAKEPDQRTQPLSGLAGTPGFPDENKIRKGIEKAMVDALGGGFFKKIASFFGKAMSGAEKKIMATLPEMDAKTMAVELADALMSSSIDDLSAKEPPAPTADPGELQSVATESQEQEQEEAEAAGEPGAEPGAEGAEEAPGDEPPPADEEEAAEEQATASEELQAAAQEQAGENQSPASAVEDAIDGWFDGLSDTSKKSLQTKNRIGGLKDGVSATFDQLADVVEKAISDAISSWRGDHEETLMKSKRFAKKNFDDLEKIIPQLASAMLKKTNESSFRLTKQSIRRSVWRFLDNRFVYRTDRLLRENKYSEEDMVIYRMNKLAGLNE